MYQGQIRTVVAIIILGGHFAVFIAGMALGLFGPLRGTDLVQVVLMTSPVLAMTATAAIRFILEGQVHIERGKRVTLVFSIVVVAFPLALICCIFLLFCSIYRQFDGFGPNELKVGLGAVETFFGAFIGMISDKLFGPISRNTLSPVSARSTP
jgi:hypothetical protein